MTVSIAPQREGHFLAAGQVVFGTMVYAGLTVGVSRLSQDLLTSMVIVGLTYLTAIYVYFGLITLGRQGRKGAVALAAGAAFIIWLALFPADDPLIDLMEIAKVLIAGALAGWLLSRGTGLLPTYLAGAGAVALLTILLYLPVFPQIMDTMKKMSVETISWMESYLAAGGAPASASDDALTSMRSVAALTVRLVPATMVMSSVIQLSIGFLGFLVLAVRRGSISSETLKFTRWIMPYQWSALVIPAVAARLWGGETLGLIADNIIFVLAFYYCVTGLALIEHVLKSLKLAMWFKVMFYLFMLLTGVVGLTLSAVLGFVDSFKDWRKLNAPDLDLKNE